jgi:hypothetical protein
MIGTEMLAQTIAKPYFRLTKPTNMKSNFYLQTLVYLLFLPSLSIAQISLESTDLTSIGDVITRYTDTVPGYGPGAEGPNQTWDFSNAVAEDTAVTTVVTVASTGFQSTFGSSDYAMEAAEGDSWLFFTHDANSMASTGAAGNLLGNGIIESPFSDPLTLHEFPRTYGSTFDDTYAFVTEASGAGLPTPIPVDQIRLTHDGHVYDTTDAYGTLITPTGTYDAIRVKSVDFTTDIIEVKLFAFAPWSEFSNTSDTSTTYSWHANEEMLAIAEMAFDSVGNPARFTYSAVPPVTTVSVSNQHEEEEISVYPQPANDFLYLRGLNDFYNYTAEIISVDARIVATNPLGSTRIAVSSLSRGMYILRLVSTDGKHEKPIRFLIE